MLSDQRTEALTILAEECAEVIQAISKVHRFGDDNIPHLEQEVGDVIAMLAILGYQGVFNEDTIMNQVPKKLIKLKQYSNLNNLDSIIKNL